MPPLCIPLKKEHKTHVEVWGPWTVSGNTHHCCITFLPALSLSFFFGVKHHYFLHQYTISCALYLLFLFCADFSLIWFFSVGISALSAVVCVRDPAYCTSLIHSSMVVFISLHVILLWINNTIYTIILHYIGLFHFCVDLFLLACTFWLIILANSPRPPRYHSQ